MKAPLISPSLLSADFANLESEVKALERASADWLHVDVMDGHFVPNLTIGPMVVAALKRVTHLPLDVHLMIEKPERYILEFLKAGSDILTIHIESTAEPETCLKLIREFGSRAGITLRPKTPIENIVPFLHLVDLVLVMTVEPGFGGQGFMHDQVKKIQYLRSMIDEKKLPVLIEVDGGINDKTVDLVADADVLVAGSFVFKSDYAQAIQRLKERKI